MKKNWQSRITYEILFLDVSSITLALSTGLFIRFPDFFSSDVSTFEIFYFIFAFTLGCAWILILTLNGSRNIRILGFGADEYKKVANSVYVMFTCIALISYIFKLELSRGFLFLGRRLLRKRLFALRRKNLANFDVLFVTGSNDDPVKLRLKNAIYAGLNIKKTFLTGSTVNTDQILEFALQEKCEVILIGQNSNISSIELRQLGWRLEEKKIALIVTPKVIEISGSRLKVSNVEGLPLLHLDQPDFRGPKRILKRIFDLVFSMLGIILLFPLFIIISTAIKLDDKGSIIYKQSRLGRRGKDFNVLKFRTMIENSHSLRESIMLETNKDLRLPKHPNDPRITRVGKFLRRWSFDEIPQIINVIKGEMSLVGPRPPLLEEVNKYQGFEKRRLLVKPGLTGLWQVSGRSQLNWEDTVRLDLYYVENWTLTLDFLIILRTAAVIWRGEGAY
jgi:exopolysaccharide biosynthesis polyprenyl glycosylphosphotransferase